MKGEGKSEITTDASAGGAAVPAVSAVFFVWMLAAVAAAAAAAAPGAEASVLIARLFSPFLTDFNRCILRFLPFGLKLFP